MIRFSNLWKEALFSSLNKDSKLLYFYLATCANINSIGTLCLNIDSMLPDLSVDIDELRAATIELREKGFIITGAGNGGVLFTVLKHFSTLPKSENLIKKAKAELAMLPQEYREILEGLLDFEKKFITFNEPTEQEIAEFCVSKGHKIDAKEVIRYYRECAAKLGKTSGWFDGRGVIVKDWEAKLQKVWFRPENRLKECKDAPKGFEFFYVVHEGKTISPDFWNNGRPMSKDGIIYNKILQREYERKRSS